MPRHVLPPVERKRKHPSHYYRNKGSKPRNRIEQVVEHFRRIRLQRDFDKHYFEDKGLPPREDAGAHALAFLLAAILSLALAVMIAVKYAY